jgi:hypothetical protein
MISTLMGDLLAVLELLALLAMELELALAPDELALDELALDELPLDEQPAIASAATPASPRVLSNRLRMVIVDPHSPSGYSG